MALKLKNFTSSYGVTYPELYYRIESVSYDNTTKQIQFGGAAYISEEAANNGTQPIPGDFQFGDTVYNAEDHKTDNLIEFAYNTIKYEASRVDGKTDEEIQTYNRGVIQECMTQNLPPIGVLKAEYKKFIGAEDC